MCDQTEVTYSPGEVVWVKLGSVWWPGQVQDYDTLDEEITSNFKKKPIAVVKFFQEDSFEYVKNLNHIYRYNCQKKEEFIKKGLDLVRSSNSRDVPSNMKMFPNDVVMAEHLTGGNPNILNEKTFAPEQKSNYTDLFGSKKLSAKKGKPDNKKEDIFSVKNNSNTNPIKNRKSLPTLPSTVPRPITHPRFIVKALEGRSDHEVRIRCQFSSPKNDDETIQKKYTCHLCGFQAARLNVIILHNKSHSAGFADAYKIKTSSKTKDREPIPTEQNSFSEKTPTITTSRGRIKVLPKKLLDYTDEPPPKLLKEKSPAKNTVEKTPEVSKPSTEQKTAKKHKDNSEKLIAKRPLFGKRKSAKEKAELAAKQKQDNEAMKETLLKDWDDDDINQEEVELERLKQALESTSSDISSDNCTSEEFSKMDVDDNDKFAESPVVTNNAKSTEDKKQTKIDDKAEIFEFDDSEDSFPVAINFRPKSQREQKFTDDKFKKPKPPKPLSKVSLKNKTTGSNVPHLSPLQDGDAKNDFENTLKKNEEIDSAEFNDAFNALLEETVAPEIPELPKSLCDQTSDISSTTDLMAETEGKKKNSKDLNLEAMEISQSCDSDNLMVESSSTCNDIKSDFEDFKAEKESIIKYDLTDLNISDSQKNVNNVSATDPGLETDSKFLSLGVPPAAEENDSFETNSEAYNSLQNISCEPAVEISSSCDSSKSVKLGCEKTDLTNDDTPEDKTTIERPGKCLDLGENVCVNKTDSDYKQVIDDSQVGCSSKESEIGNKDVDLKRPILKDDSLNFRADNVVIKESCNTMLDKSDEVEKLLGTKEEINVFSDINLNPVSTLIKHEEIIVSQINSSPKEEHIIIKQDDPKFFKRVPSDSSSSNRQILTGNSEFNTVQVISHEQSSHTISSFALEQEQPQSNASIQNIGQSLQDMELDINSMPVIIGGEDFMQPDETKNVISDKSNYSESIVVSPKTVSQTQSPNKPEGLIMKIEIPTSSQNVQSVINIPNKSTRGGVRGGRTQKPSSKTIKLSASTLKNLGNLHKGGNQQVLILKTAGSQEKPDGSPDKSKPALNMVQHGNKILILNNAQMSGQTAIKLNPQHLLSGGKLSAGTRVLTSKVASATSSTQSASNLGKTTFSRSPSKQTKKVVFSQASGILATTSKSVLINSSSGKLVTVPSTQAITTSKGKSVVTHNILGSKGSLILPTPSLSAPSNSQTSTVLTSHTLSPGQSTMILAPISSKGGTVLAGNQKLRIVTSKAPISGTRFVVQNTQGKIALDPLNKNQQLKIVSGLKGAQQGSAFLIKTNQNVFSKPITTSSITVASKPSTVRASNSKTILTTIPTQAKISGVLTKPDQSQVVQHPKMLQQAQIIQPQIAPTSQIILNPQGQTQVVTQDLGGKKSTTVKRVSAPKSRPSNSQKAPRKTTPRTPKSRGNRYISPAIKDPVVIAPSNVPIVGQSTMVQGQLPQNSEVLYLALDESGNYRPLDNKSLVTLQRPSDAPSPLFIPANNQPQEVGNIFIAIDESGNIINISQPTPNVSVSSHSTSGQDILAKALENTQVFQQETIIPDIDVSEALSSSSVGSSTLVSSFSDHSQYTPTLSHNVLETSLTLNQPPIMTPLEVPSVVSPNLGSMTLPTNFVASELLSTQPKPLSPSMPLLTEEVLTNQNHSEQVFVLDSSNNMIPAGSGSQLSLQLAINDRKIIVSSDSGCVSSAKTFGVVAGDVIETESGVSNELNNMQNIVQEECIIEQGDFKTESVENIVPNSHLEPYQESLGAPQITDHQNSIIIQEALETSDDHAKYNNLTTDISSLLQDNENKSDAVREDHHVGKFETDNTAMHDETALNSCSADETLSEELRGQQKVREESEYSLKRGLEEERTVSSSSDLEDDPKRMKIDER